MSNKLTKKVAEETSPASLVPERKHPKNCRACTHSYMEPSGAADLVCGHKDAGVFGKTLKWSRNVLGTGATLRVVSEIRPDEHCGDFTKFEQHPLRHENGDLNPSYIEETYE